MLRHINLVSNNGPILKRLSNMENVWCIQRNKWLHFNIKWCDHMTLYEMHGTLPLWNILYKPISILSIRPSAGMNSIRELVCTAAYMMIETIIGKLHRTSGLIIISHVKEHDWFPHSVQNTSNVLDLRRWKCIIVFHYLLGRLYKVCLQIPLFSPGGQCNWPCKLRWAGQLL